MTAAPTALPADHAVMKLRGYQVAIRREQQLRGRIFAPPPQYTVSEWADHFRMLTSIASAEPGRWRTDRAPYQRGIMDAFCDPCIERVAVKSSAQVGKTEIILNVIGYFTDQDPAPILVLQPTIEMARAFSKDRLREMLRASTKLRPKFQESSRREAEDTILHKQFPGGQITMAGANSAAGLAMRPIRVVLNDEVDRFPASAGDEGDPVSLAKKRTLTFWNRKEGLFSTPTITDASRIDAAFNEGDQRRYHVPCPHCAHLQHLRWEQLDFETASYICESCGALIEETHKPWMLRDEPMGGQACWVASKPGGTTASFHLNALYSPWVTWRYLIKEYREAKGSTERYRTFINTVLGETWAIDGESIDTSALGQRREQYAAEVPAGVGIMTGAIDVQKDRLELQVKGYGAGQESWLIAHHRLYGDPSQKDVWDRADALLVKGYAHESGATIYISAVSIDSGDGQTVQHVYGFVRPRQKRGVFATKGLSVRGRPIVNRPGRANKYGVKVFPIGTETAKDVIFARLMVGEPGPGYMHFPRIQKDGADDEYLNQFGAEKAFIRRTKGAPFREYRQVRDRNEAIDLEVGCLHALHLLGAGVYDQLAAWVAKIQDDGAKVRAAAAAAATTAPVAAPVAQWIGKPPTNLPGGPRAPRGPGGYVNKWRR